MALAQILMVSAVVPSMLLIWYFRSRDANPEPAAVLWKTFGLGVLTVIPVLMVALPIGSAIEGVQDPVLSGFLKAFLTAAGPEEFFKFTVVTLYCARHKEFDEPMDGVVYGATASLGFATLENVLYVSSGGLGVAVMRALLAVPGHAFMGAVMGYFVGQAKFRPAEKSKLLALGYFVPFLLHGLYDWPLLSMKESSGARAADNSAIAPLLLVTLATFVFEWVWTVRIIRRLRAEQHAWAPRPALGQQLAQPPQWQPQYPQPAYANPYAVAPQWAPAPMAQPNTARPVLAVFILIVGVLLATGGGMMALGGIASFFIPEAGVTGDAVVGVIAMIVLMGVIPLLLGIACFIYGVRKLSGP
ncbi:MAG: PrsW family glutamic-type intramembrane protease [Polyangiales bacterium]